MLNWSSAHRVLCLLGLLLLPLGSAIGCKGERGETDAAGGDSGSGPISCEFGEDASKCSASTELACGPTLLSPAGECERDQDCEDEELCFARPEDPRTGTCHRVGGACTAVGAVRTGKPFGEACDPEGAKDECAGSCVAIGTEGRGECEETCRVGASRGCGQEELADSAVACAFYAYELEDAGISQGAGDLGICAKLCYCNADCPGDQLCLNNPVEPFAGICAGGLAREDTVEECPGEGAGGAPGEGGAGGLGGGAGSPGGAPGD